MVDLEAGLDRFLLVVVTLYQVLAGDIVDDGDLTDEVVTFTNATTLVPVTGPGASSKSVMLPPGTWFDFWTGVRHEGGQTVSVPVALDTIPVLVRAGSFIPMTPDIETTAGQIP